MASRAIWEEKRDEDVKIRGETYICRNQKL